MRIRLRTRNGIRCRSRTTLLPLNEEDEQDEGNQGFADASTYGRSRLHQMPRAREDGTGKLGSDKTPPL